MISQIKPRITTIRVKTTTRDILKEFGVKGDSYDEIILRALAWQERGKVQLQKQRRHDTEADERVARIQELLVVEEKKGARA